MVREFVAAACPQGPLVEALESHHQFNYKRIHESVT
jgi:hypothetical protein